jgi:hypothetical protein
LSKIGWRPIFSRPCGTHGRPGQAGSSFKFNPGLASWAFGKTCALSALSALSVLVPGFRRGESVRHKRPMRHKSPATGPGPVRSWCSVVKEPPILEVRTGRSTAHCAIVCSLRGLVGGRRKTDRDAVNQFWVTINSVQRPANDTALSAERVLSPRAFCKLICGGTE